MTNKPTLTFTQIWNMSFGFLGVQFGMGLTLANMSPIYRYLGADEASLPILWLAGPITGLVIQPIIGTLGDNTWGKWGRRRPYFTIGAIIASICLIAMPYSPAIWVAAGLLWVLDASVNTSMESFRALLGDSLSKEQQPTGFSVQTFMIGIGQLFSALMPYILTLFGVAVVAESNTVPDFVKYAFVLGAAIILSSILWTGYTTKEYPPEDMESFKKRKKERGGGLLHAFMDILQAVKEMPLALRQIWWVKLAIWYGFPLMWQYLSLTFARHIYGASAPQDVGFSDGVAMGGVGMAIYCSAPILMSFIFNPLITKYGTRKLWALFLAIGGLGFIAFLFTNSLPLFFLFCFLIGVGFSGICTLPYLMLTRTVPQERIGVYMGILNAFICIPQIISMLTIPFYYDSILGGDPRNALILAGVLWIIAAFLSLRITKSVDESFE